jgi:hypothetical protein
MSARRKASCSKTRSHYGFVTPRRRTQRAGADLSSTVPPARYRIRLAAVCIYRPSAQRLRLANLSAVPGLSQGSDRRAVVGGLQPAESASQIMIDESSYEERMRITHKCSRRRFEQNVRIHLRFGFLNTGNDHLIFRRAVCRHCDDLVNYRGHFAAGRPHMGLRDPGSDSHSERLIVSYLCYAFQA